METLDGVLFSRGLGNSKLADEILAELKEYSGNDPKIIHINYGRFGDGELDDRFPEPDYEHIKDKTLVFFECLKDESIMLRFLQLCWAAKHQYGARRVIAVLFFMHYRRQDRNEYIHEIWRNLWLTEQMKNSGVSHVILVTPHSEKTRMNFEENGIEFKNIDLSDLFANRLKSSLPEEGRKEKVRVYAPDKGAIPRAIKLAKHLEVGVLFSLKNRGFNNETEIVEADKRKIEEIKEKFNDFPEIEYATPDRVNGMTIVMAEDEVDSGGTANKQAIQLKKYGVLNMYLFFTHAVCTDPWRRKLFSEDPFCRVLGSNTILRGEEKRTGGKIHDISAAPPIASELFRILQSFSG